ncbi:hypothetical protein PRUPE_5G100200 [Prunus persica]|uniref:Uncharacterized protein n=1 Tax=Prunus persica TaxID=3760 RepID=M5W8F9_PRUPE|nr:uncharacterized protein LOC18776996 isoform X1 [Prunus persica]ONI07103.1 hypothetical protein PRUPE_5G100200 [Prunus persica]
MAGCNKRHKNDQPSIKYRWYPVGQASSGLADFVHEKYPPFVSDKINKQRSRKPEPKSPAILSNAMLISAVGQIWDCASRPLGFFQPKAHSNHNDSGCQKEVVLADLGREGNDVAPISAKSKYLTVDLMQPSLDFLQVSEKMSVFEPYSGSYCHSSLWRFLHGGGNVSQESWKGKGLASLEVSYQLGSIYGWMSDTISSGLKCPVKVTEIENRTGQYCILEDTNNIAGGSISGDTVNIAGGSISGDSSSPVDNLTTNAYNLSLYENEKLEMNTRTSLTSDYFLRAVGSEVDGSISRTPCSNLYTDYHIDLLASCKDQFEESHHKIDDHEQLESKKKQSEIFIIQDECKTEIGALACEKPHYALAKQEHAFAGALSGIVVSVCLHPVDTIKTVVQSCRAEQKSLCYIGKSIVSDRGLTGLYRGIATNIASSAPISAVYTFTYESVKGALLPLFPKEYYSFAHCMAGGCASIATSFIFTPSERIKQQMQVGSHYNNCWNALVGIVRNGGLPSLYAGWGAVLCRNVPHSIVKFYTYESLKQFMLSPNEASVHPTTLQTLVCGGLAGSTAALLTTPFDVVKTRLQTQIPGSMSQYNSVIHALQEIGKNEGLKGLYRGLTPRLVMYMSQGALFFASYEFFKSLFSLDTPQTDAPRIQYQQKTEGNPVLPSSLPAMSSPASSELRGLHS